MNLLADLTPAQLEAVTHVDGPLLVLAAAGSGKTRVITRRVAYMLAQGIGGGNILALTFTNKAAGEMKERIEALVPKSGVWVGTFHGLCARLLRSYAPLVGIDRGFTIFDQSDRLRAVKDAMERLELEDASVTPERIDSAISRAKNDLVTPEVMAKRVGDHVQAITAKVYARYQERLKESSAVDFDDLLVHLVTILKNHPDVRADLDARFRYVLVDEYQDTNLAQYAIIKALCVDRPNLCVTGDPPATSRFTAGAGPTSRTSSSSRRNSRAARWSSSSGTTGAPRTFSWSPIPSSATTSSGNRKSSPPRTPRVIPSP